MTRQFTNRRLLALVAPASLVAGLSEAKVTGDPDLMKTCIATASAKLGVKASDISVLPTEKTGKGYFVYGQSSMSGRNPATFECRFGNDRKLKKLVVTSGGTGGTAATSTSGVPAAAEARCRDMMGVPTKIDQVSALKPGFHEIILSEVTGKRKVACTVSDKGEIADWVEMN